jgi:hypothetical protein
VHLERDSLPLGDAEMGPDLHLGNVEKD